MPKQLPRIPSGQEYLLYRSDVAFTAPDGKKWAKVGYLRIEALQGIKAFNFEGYTIIENQMLIGIDPKAVKGRLEVKVRNSSTGAVRNTTRPTTALDVARAFVEDLQSHTNTKYTLVSDKPAQASGTGAHWFWIAPNTVISRLHKAAPGGHFSLLGWGSA